MPPRSWGEESIKDPNVESFWADVVIATPVLASGISIDTHYREAFYFLHSGVLTHDGSQSVLAQELKKAADRTQIGRVKAQQSSLLSWFESHTKQCLSIE